MGKNRNKNKKIYKQKQQVQNKKKQINKQQQKYDKQQKQDDNIMDEQLLRNQGLFQQFANADQNGMQVFNDNKLESDGVQIEKCKLGSGWMYILNAGSCYRLRNGSASKVDVSIVSGAIDINGKLYQSLFYLKPQHHIIVQANQLQNIQTVRNQKQIADNEPLKKLQKLNKKQEKKNKNSQNKDEKQKLGSIKFQILNKNIKQIVSKIKINREINSVTNFQDNKIQSLAIDEQVLQFLHNYEQQQNVLIWTAATDLSVTYCEKNKKPWEGLDIEKYLGKGERTLLIGPKNTGKSMLCQYLENKAQSKNVQICVLDLDLGRNRAYPGCVSLFTLDAKGNKSQISLWVGEYTPLNSIPLYIQTIHQLFSYYKQKHFTSSLIINTMGYLSGLGELILYQTFDILKPHRVLFMEAAQNQQFYFSKNIRNELSSGGYIYKLYFQIASNSTKTSTKIQKYTNLFADQKSTPQRFQALLTSNPLKNINDLILLILGRKLNKIKKHLQIYRNNKNGQLSKIENQTAFETNMRIILLGKLWNGKLLEVKGVGYGWNGSIFSNKNQIQQNSLDIGVISDGIDFQRSFYQINQSRIIQLEEILGHELPYICPIFKVLGNKGMRNNPGKKITVNNQ